MEHAQRNAALTWVNRGADANLARRGCEPCTSIVAPPVDDSGPPTRGRWHGADGSGPLTRAGPVAGKSVMAEGESPVGLTRANNQRLQAGRGRRSALIPPYRVIRAIVSISSSTLWRCSTMSPEVNAPATQCET